MSQTQQVKPAQSKWKPELFSSNSNEWATPQDLFDALNTEFNFGLDVAASSLNHKTPAYYTEQDNALAQSWRGQKGAVWCNPPYGRDIGNWVRKAFDSSRDGKTTVVLTFARTDTKWWHEWAMQADEIRFIQGRVHFVRPDGTSGPAPAPSAVLVYYGRAARIWGDHWQRATQVRTAHLPRGLKEK
jgi:phage N-6-adenine-methyltransferase